MPQLFEPAILTTSGAELLAAAQAGSVTIEFTKIAVGDGMFSDTENLRERTSLKSEKNAYVISGKSIVGNSTVKLTAVLTNQDPVTLKSLVTNGYYINEIGLYARAAGGDELLYSIAKTAGEKGDYMPSLSEGPTQVKQAYYVTVNDSLTVTVEDKNAETATEEVDGLMSAEDKKKLNGIAEGANKITYYNPANFHTAGAVQVAHDSVTEIGRYLDMHCEDPENTAFPDYSVRLVATAAGKMALYKPGMGVGTLTANLEGNATSAGKATAADKLAAARTINGVSFDGSANISIPMRKDVLFMGQQKLSESTTGVTLSNLQQSEYLLFELSFRLKNTNGTYVGNGDCGFFVGTAGAYRILSGRSDIGEISAPPAVYMIPVYVDASGIGADASGFLTLQLDMCIDYGGLGYYISADENVGALEDCSLYLTAVYGYY